MKPNRDPPPPQPTRALGAFVTDIRDSTERIETFGEEALDTHRTYLESFFDYYRTYLPEILRRYYRAEDFWFPGDAMWGIFLKHDGRSISESIVLSMWHYVFSAACSLSKAQRGSESLADLPELHTRGVFLAGEVHDPRFDDRIKIFGGRALNACGRLEKEVPGNSLELGFILDRMHGGQEMFQPVAGSPRLSVSGFQSYLRDLYRFQTEETAISGCRIELDTVEDGTEHLLRFRGWSKRKSLRGLGNCQLLTTRVRLVPTDSDSIEVIPTRGSHTWSRGSLELRPRPGPLDLYEILAASQAEPFSFMKEIYQEGEIVFNVSCDSTRSLSVECKSRTFKPRLKDQRSASLIDLRTNECLLLPTNKHRYSGGFGVMVQCLPPGASAIRLCKVLVKRDLDDRWSDYLDSGQPTLDVKIACAGAEGTVDKALRNERMTYGARHGRQ